jgi:hypothetical protein
VTLIRRPARDRSSPGVVERPVQIPALSRVRQHARILDSNFHREVGWRSAKGLQRQVHKYGPARLESACERALVFGARSYKPVERMLKLGRETTPLPGAEPAERAPIAHENVRGPEYYN